MNSIQDLLTEASEDLYWVSEADYPFEVIVWDEGNLSEQKLLERLGYPADFPVKTIDIDEFFQAAIQEQDWQDEIEKAEVRQYQILVETLKAHLTDLRVYKLGETEFDIYILGKTPSGENAGLLTKAVET